MQKTHIPAGPDIYATLDFLSSIRQTIDKMLDWSEIGLGSSPSFWKPLSVYVCISGKTLKLCFRRTDGNDELLVTTYYCTSNLGTWRLCSMRYTNDFVALNPFGTSFLENRHLCFYYTRASSFRRILRCRLVASAVDPNLSLVHMTRANCTLPG